MARWHEASCETPDVFSEDGKPRCRRCGTSLDLQALVERQETAENTWGLPPDEDVGAMNLHWPASVKYTQDGESPEHLGNNTASNLTQEMVSRMLSPIYENRLLDGQFRLLCLTAPVCEKQPIHVTLETYADDDHPEYETVSYAWGGEDGDSSKTRPVYVGEYWDVLLQTKNCWSLLKYLRPRRGIRLIWLDAVCINQDDTTEREMQIAKMGMIYQQSSRVVVYLGNDVVRASTSSRQYPRRHRLHDIFGSDAALKSKLERMLELRYFSRVWVIQELLLAPNALIAIDDVEFTAGPKAGVQGWNWNSSKAPWLEFLCNGSSLRQKNLFDVIDMALESEASDPRDKLFGLLGLVSSDVAKDLAPDYSISILHTHIGISAYAIFNLKESIIFLAAAGRRSLPTYPSWVPNWEGYRLLGKFRKWNCAFQFPEMRGLPNVQFRGGFSSENPAPPSIADVLDNDNQLRMEALPPPEGKIGCIQLHGEPLGAIANSLADRAGYQVNRAGSGGDMIAWDSEVPSINRTSASLSLNLVHLFTVTSKPRHIRRFRVNRMEVSIFQFGSTHCRIYLTASHVDFNEFTDSEPMDIFALLDDRHPEIILFFLEKVTDTDKYRLVETCPCYDLTVQYPFEPTSPGNVRIVTALMRGIHDGFEVETDLHRDLSEMGSLVESSHYASFLTKSWRSLESQLSVSGQANVACIRDDIRCTLHSQRLEARNMLGDLGRRIYFHSSRRPVNFLVLRQIFLQSSEALMNILTLMQHLVNADTSFTSNFMDNYLMFIYKEHPETQPVLRDDMLHISPPISARPDFFLRPAHNDTPYVNIPWEWSVNTRNNTEPASWAPCDMEFDKLSVSMGLPLSEFRLRAPIDRIKMALRNTLYYATLLKLTPARRHTGEEELAMLLREPKNEDRYICMNSWPQVVIDEFQAVGKIRRVEIA